MLSCFQPLHPRPLGGTTQDPSFRISAQTILSPGFLRNTTAATQGFLVLKMDPGRCSCEPSHLLLPVAASSTNSLRQEHLGPHPTSVSHKGQSRPQRQ